ncbi:MAG: TPM domain-containing protein [Proteobacteria bacterium]|nr:TPM domain-containing protein [Pseudomonadota bacterium]MCP4917923.1 TPM domain-containing protein [Pseudomonadota bacterium]
MWCLITSAWALEPEAVPNPRDEGGWVVDLAEVLSDADEAQLNERITALERDTTVEVAVVTVDSVSGTPKEFATGLFNHWGIGKASNDNGLLVVLVMEQRRLEMETGYGLEATLPDSWLGSMQVQHMVPLFKNGDFGQGLVVGVEAIDARVRGDTTVHDGVAGATAGRPDVPVDPMVPIGGIALLALVGGGVVYGRAKHKRNRQCDKHGDLVDMVKLDEVEDDAHLTEGQQAEESLGSVDYDVYACPQCDETRMFTDNKWFSGYGNCPSCANKTAKTSRSTVVPATYTSSGYGEASTICLHCDHSSTSTYNIPMKVRSTSSSSSGGGGFSGGGGGSFGGGSSGGGGAGSSW